MVVAAGSPAEKGGMPAGQSRYIIINRTKHIYIYLELALYAFVGRNPILHAIEGVIGEEIGTSELVAGRISAVGSLSRSDGIRDARRAKSRMI